MFSCKSWTLYLNDEQTAEGCQSTNKYFFLYRHTGLLVLSKVTPPKFLTMHFFSLNHGQFVPTFAWWVQRNDQRY